MIFLDLFKRKKNPISYIEESVIEQPKSSVDEEEWKDISKEKPGHEVVLAACDTYDCGWIIDSVWWNKEDECWMTTGDVESVEAHLPYTHWRRMPKPPKN